MTKVYYISASGIAYVDDVAPKFRAIEFRDGYHPITNDCIWRSGERNDESVMFIWQGRSSPEGQDPSKVRFFIKKNNRLKDNRQPLLVSRFWYRQFKKAVWTCVWTGVFIFLLYVGYTIYIATTQM